MAKAPAPASTENGSGEATAAAPFGFLPDGTPRKRAAPTGPRKSKPVYVLFRAKDAEGNTIQGAQLEVVVATKDTDKFLAALDQNPDATRTKLEIAASESD